MKSITQMSLDIHSDLITFFRLEIVFFTYRVCGRQNSRVLFQVINGAKIFHIKRVKCVQNYATPFIGYHARFYNSVHNANLLAYFCSRIIL